jgi:hypothetical protein
MALSISEITHFNFHVDSSCNCVFSHTITQVKCAWFSMASFCNMCKLKVCVCATENWARTRKRNKPIFGHYPSSQFQLKNTTFRRLESLSILRFSLFCLGSIPLLAWIWLFLMHFVGLIVFFLIFIFSFFRFTDCGWNYSMVLGTYSYLFCCNFMRGFFILSPTGMCCPT